jgi:hypothetical protein
MNMNVGFEWITTEAYGDWVDQPGRDSPHDGAPMLSNITR